MVATVTTLPAPVRHLIERKLRLLKRELEQEHVGTMQHAYSRLQKGMRDNLGTGAIGRMLVTVPMEVYREIAANALAITRRWPAAVWEAIANVSDNAGVHPNDGTELNAIVDEYAWAMEQAPFPVDYAAPERFREAVFREASMYEIEREDIRASFEHQLDTVAAANTAGIRNTARQAREAVAIAIGEWIARGQTSPETAGGGEHAKAHGPTVAAASVRQSPCSIFLAMQGLTADELSIAFVGDRAEEGIGAKNMLEISARGETKRVPLPAMDLVNRTSGTLNSQGAVMLGLAQGESLLGAEKNAKKVSRLRDALPTHLGIKDDPFERHQPGVGWRPRFKITDRTGAADERAKRKAERRTVSYDRLAETLDRDRDADNEDSWAEVNSVRQNS